jgi:uncharacterized protein YjaG (DUF416 family)
MMLTYSQDRTLARLEALPPSHRAAFAAACAQRIVGNYYVFHSYEGFGDPVVLVRALSRVWELLPSPEIGTRDREMLADLARQCFDLAPDSWEFPESHLVGFALDAAAAVTCSIECLLEGNPQTAVCAADHVYSSIDGFVVEKYGPFSYLPGRFNEEWKIVKHPIVQAELRHQEDDLRYLERSVRVDGETVAHLRRRSESRGVELRALLEEAASTWSGH